MNTQSCDSYEMREGTLLSISKVPSAFNLRLCVIIIWVELDPILNLTTFQLHTIMVWHHFNPFQQKWNIPKTFPPHQKKRKKKLQFPSPKETFFEKNSFSKKFHMSKNNVIFRHWTCYSTRVAKLYVTLLTCVCEGILVRNWNQRRIVIIIVM
jgi:hypothetical protein